MGRASVAACAFQAPTIPNRSLGRAKFPHSTIPTQFDITTAFWGNRSPRRFHRPGDNRIHDRASPYNSSHTIQLHSAK